MLPRLNAVGIVNLATLACGCGSSEEGGYELARRGRWHRATSRDGAADGRRRGGRPSTRSRPTHDPRANRRAGGRWDVSRGGTALGLLGARRDRPRAGLHAGQLRARHRRRRRAPMCDRWRGLHPARRLTDAGGTTQERLRRGSGAALPAAADPLPGGWRRQRHGHQGQGRWRSAADGRPGLFTLALQVDRGRDGGGAGRIRGGRRRGRFPGRPLGGLPTSRS